MRNAYLVYQIRWKFANTRVILKQYHVAKCGDGKQEKHAKLIEKTYRQVYNTDITHLISIDCEEVNEEMYKHYKDKYEEAI